MPTTVMECGQCRFWGTEGAYWEGWGFCGAMAEHGDCDACAKDGQQLHETWFCADCGWQPNETERVVMTEGHTQPSCEMQFRHDFGCALFELQIPDSKVTTGSTE